MHHVARINVAQTDASVERRGDVAEAQIQPRGFDLGIVAQERRGVLLDHGLLGVELLAGREIAAHQRIISRQVGLCVR